jgi:pyruvate,water dikinase
MGDLTPGTTGADAEQRVLGFARDLPDRSTNRRLPFVAVRLPVQVATIGRRIRARLASTRAWWSASTAVSPPTFDASVALLLDARRRFEEIIVEHTTSTIVGLLFAESLERLTAPTGIPHIVDRATTGLGDLEELAMVRDLQAAADGRLDLAEVVARHGFHGPDEGQLQAPSWRQAPQLLHRAVSRYGELGAERRPDAVLARQQSLRAKATDELTGTLRGWRRPVARFLLRRTAAAAPLREVGKTAFLMALDVGRHAATAAGQHLVDRGQLEQMEDVFLLTVDELAALPVDLGALLEERRGRQAQYQRLDLPAIWQGMPEPIELVADDGAAVVSSGAVLAGEGAAPGCAEGRLLVAPDLATAFDAEPGDIVACRTTDPSWAAVFPVIGGIAVEVGSHTSHAAIVARELGLPCVVGIDGITERLRTGMQVRIDADAGTLEVLATEGVG